MKLVRTELLPRGFDAMTVWPFIFVRHARAADAGLIEHELVHYREQAWLRGLVWLPRYLLSATFRLAAEVRAYRRQIEVGGITPAQAAQYLTTYRTGVTLQHALQLLTATEA